MGLTNENMEDLNVLDPSRFEHKEWVALRYARDYTYLGGHEPAGQVRDDFIKLYNRQEREDILKLIRMMRFANYFSNLVFKRPWRRNKDDAEACSIGNFEGR